MDAERFGAFVQARRKELGLSQTALAEKLHVTAKAVSRWERGVGFPDIKLLQPLADALEITIVELMNSEKISRAITKETASDMVTQTVQQIQEQEQLNWKKRILLYLGNTVLFLAYMFLFMLANTYQLQPWWLSIPVIFIAVFGFQYGTRALKAIITGTKLETQEWKRIHITWKMWLALALFTIALTILILAATVLDGNGQLRDFLVVLCLMTILFSGLYYSNQIMEK